MFWSHSSGRAYRARLNGTGSLQLATGLGTPCKFSISMHISTVASEIYVKQLQ